MAKHGITDDFFSLAGSKKTKKKKRDKRKSEKLGSGPSDLSASASPSVSFSKDPSDLKEIDAIHDEQPDISIFTSSSPSTVTPKAALTETDPISDDVANDTDADDLEVMTVPPESFSSQLLGSKSSVASSTVSKPGVELTSFATSFTTSLTKPPAVTNEYETRRYQLVIHSKLPVIAGTNDKITVICRGLKSFSKVISAALTQFKKRYAADPQVASAYNEEDTCLVWKEGLTVINSGWSPSYLRIPHTGGDKDDTEVVFLLIPKSHEHDYETFYPDFGYTNPDDVNGKDDVLNVELDEANDDTAPAATATADSSMLLGLKGADNKRIDVHATAETPIRQLLQEYLKAKKLDPTTKATLIFDDEPLSLNDTVGDTELEDEFEIQVML
ncbi:hypothetical protein DIURU_003931 [Diutina rugosa]|uniref:Rad60/SUMO-like domain-containing protein n=1 Tax=Diutina rugosa TaxID=5481 RepID=A0A642UJ69_DIURU|nr:uncharacterized protein DIURU_003931 [Diutina rugosa]KAA8900115.1 hypothetical protein DIURU_003931 [Diutina rugosa]